MTIFDIILSYIKRNKCEYISLLKTIMPVSCTCMRILNQDYNVVIIIPELPFITVTIMSKYSNYSIQYILVESMQFPFFDVFSEAALNRKISMLQKGRDLKTCDCDSKKRDNIHGFIVFMIL